MAKKAGKIARDPGVVDIFSVLGDPEPQDDGSEGDQKAKEGADPGLQAKIGALEANLRRLERTNTALMAQNGTFSPQNSAQPLSQEVSEPDFSGLPDPVTDGEAYHKEVTKRISAHIRSQMEQDAQAQAAQMEASRSREQQVNSLWGDFEEKYPDLAAHRDLVEVAAISVANKARAKGVDVQRYMFAASDQYIEDVAQEMQKRFGKALEVLNKDGEGEEGSEEQPEGKTMTEALAAARTKGIQGGLPTSGKAGKEGEVAPEARDDLVGDLQKVQRAMGII